MCSVVKILVPRGNVDRLRHDHAPLAFPRDLNKPPRLRGLAHQTAKALSQSQSLPTWRISRFGRPRGPAFPRGQKQSSRVNDPESSIGWTAGGELVGRIAARRAAAGPIPRGQPRAFAGSRDPPGSVSPGEPGRMPGAISDLISPLMPSKPSALVNVSVGEGSARPAVISAGPCPERPGRSGARRSTIARDRPCHFPGTSPRTRTRTQLFVLPLTVAVFDSLHSACL